MAQENSKEDSVKQMSRLERIREEGRRALEFGLVPRRPLSLDPRFRVEGLRSVRPPVQLAARAPDCPHARVDQNVQRVVSRSANPFLRPESPELLRLAIEAELPRLTRDDGELATRVLRLAGQLLGAAPNDERALRLHRRVIERLFGEEYFHGEKTATATRGAQGRGGMAGRRATKGE